MRLNRFVALATGMSRRDADKAISAGRVRIGDDKGEVGQVIDEQVQQIYLDDTLLSVPESITIVLNKPAGYVVSRAGQGSKTVYDLLPADLYHLKPVGRLDKDSSGLLLLTNDGQLAAELTHPRYAKEKVYEVALDRPLSELHRLAIEKGIELDDGLSQFRVSPLAVRDSAEATPTANSQLRASTTYGVHMHEGRNRQIRRTFGELGYTVTNLHRVGFGPYHLGSLEPGTYRLVKSHQD
jgi:23S rRNA pseudouridine2605 synthase